MEIALPGGKTCKINAMVHFQWLTAINPLSDLLKILNEEGRGAFSGGAGILQDQHFSLEVRTVKGVHKEKSF